MTTNSELPQLHHLKTVKQLCIDYPGVFTEGSLRWLIFNAEHNGFASCIIRMGRRLFIDLPALRQWLADHRGMNVGSLGGRYAAPHSNLAGKRVAEV